QGVRTWGGVRVALAGAVFAFARLARRRGIPLRLATTGNKGQLIDPLSLTAESLGAILEASDLTARPGRPVPALPRGPGGPPRGVVILTPPRSLTDDAFIWIARRERAADRLFAVSVDSQGGGRLDQLREGRPVALSRFRLDLVAAQAPPALPRTAATFHVGGW